MTKGTPYGSWVDRELQRRRVSQRSLAVRAGVAHTTVHRIVTGDVDPRISTVIKIAFVLGWPGLEEVA